MKMRIASFLLLTFASAASAGVLNGNCDIRILGTSTLHDFSGTVRCQPFPVSLVGDAEGRMVIPGVEIAVLVEEMDTQNKSRDKQMREMFQGGKFPRIQAVLLNLDPDKILREMRNDPNGKGMVELTLKIRDVERRIQAVIGNLRENPGRVSFDAEFPLSLKEYDLKPPTVFFGAIRVGDKVTVNAAFRLEEVPSK
ncbi:MAG: YceI family protein [Candidatus Deferrimicrobiota bacterium]